MKNRQDEPVENSTDEEILITPITENQQTPEINETIIDNEPAYMMGATDEVYYASDDCPQDCSNRGICLNSTCFCDQGFSNNDCSMKYKEYLEKDYKISDYVLYLIITCAASMLLTLIFLIIKRSKRITGDYLELEE